MSFGYDPELPRGYQDADLEQRELEAAGNEWAYNIKQVDAAIAAGDLEAAAEACPHSGSGYPLDSEAARMDKDPDAGQEGFRCTECGSHLTRCPHVEQDGEWIYRRPGVVTPCNFLKSRGRQ